MADRPPAISRPRSRSFALTGMADRLPSYGANRNALMLCTIGARALCADDDTVCRLGTNVLRWRAGDFRLQAGTRAPRSSGSTRTAPQPSSLCAGMATTARAGTSGCWEERCRVWWATDLAGQVGHRHSRRGRRLRDVFIARCPDNNQPSHEGASGGIGAVLPARHFIARGRAASALADHLEVPSPDHDFLQHG